MLKKDSIEYDENYKDIIREVNLLVEKELKQKGITRGLGYIHHFDSLKKEKLKELYNIDWSTTSEMNPGVLLD